MKYSKNILSCMFLVLFTQTLWAQNTEEMVGNYLNGQVGRGLLLSEDIGFKITSEHVSSVSGVHHIYFSQQINNVQIYGTESSLHASAKKNTPLAKNRFVKGSSGFNRTQGATLTPLEAIEVAGRHLGIEIKERIKLIEQKNEKQQEFLFSNGGISKVNIPVKQRYLLIDEVEIVLVWELSIFELNEEHWWSLLLDSNSGAILMKSDKIITCDFNEHPESKKELDYNRNLVNKSNLPGVNDKLSSCSDCYEVFARPIESPYYGERTTVVSPAHQVASPFGWHDNNGDIEPESFKTSGNNVLAFSDNSGDTFYQPNGGAELSFIDFPFDEIFSEMDPYTDASVTNSFYWANVMHDVMYQYGFDEDAGNFQENNYGRGGEGHDPIKVVGQSSGRPCNAFFAAGPDGTRGYIGVNICNDKDGNFDNIVVLHEYGHGVSSRLVCGNAVDYCLNNKEQMGEGWSDIYALILTMSPDDTDEDPRGIATYLLGQGPNGNGGRTYPYTTNTSVNPYTYDSIKAVGYPHGVGTIWATMLWELTWNLINEHGFNADVYNFTGDFNTDAGNIMMLAIITEAMKYMDAAPGFVDARDAILEADLAIYDGKNQCLIWDAFIKRGLGYGASQGSTYLLDDGRESFESFPEEATFEIETENVCLIKGVLKGLRGGYPYGGIFSGQGVLDDGNGYSYTFDPQVAGIGTHEITYELFDTNCTVASSYMDTVMVFFDEESPQIDCPEDIELTIPANQKGYTMIQFYSQENIDSCNPVPEYTQDPAPGTLIGPGNNAITIYATIPNGDRSSCVFNIKVQTTVGEEYNSMSIYPNPTSEEITVLSRIELEITEILIWDISGKQVKKFNFSSFGFKKSLLIDDLAPGVYFIKLDSEIFNSVEKMIKL